MIEINFERINKEIEMKVENQGAQITVPDQKRMRALERVGGDLIAHQEKVNWQQD